MSAAAGGMGREVVGTRDPSTASCDASAAGLRRPPCPALPCLRRHFSSPPTQSESEIYSRTRHFGTYVLYELVCVLRASSTTLVVEYELVCILNALYAYELVLVVDLRKIYTSRSS